MAHVNHDEVLELAARGYGLTEIAERVGCSTRHVSRIKRKNGVTAPQAGPLTDTEVEEARRLLDDGAPLHEVARTLGRSPCALRLRFPDYRPWTREQVSAFGKLRRLERLLG